MSYKTYQEYFDSNIGWIGEIPKHWGINNLKKYFFIHNGSTPKDFEENWEGDICWITPADYKTSDVYINHSSRQITKTGLNSCGTTLVPKGSIIVSNRAPIGTVAIANIDLCTNQGCKSLSIKKDINTKFVYYVLSINQDELNKLGRGTTFMELSSYDLGTFQIPITSLSEQKQIVYYLDKKTAKIDATIAKNKELIDLLEEKRVALINQVVTKGLNPDVPMKDSGIEWIGEIPEHYSITKLKFLTSKIGSGKTPKGGSEIYVSEGIPLLRSQNIHFDSIRLDDVVYITEEINQNMLSTVVKNNDVLLNITGASIGRCNYIKEIKVANVNQHVCIIRPNKKIFYKYLTYFLQSECGQNQVFLNQNGTSREGLNFEDLSNFYIVLSNDIKEQKMVVSYLEKEINRIYVTINKVKENIGLLEEYKTSLIHHVVTGKIDVRGEEI